MIENFLRRAALSFHGSKSYDPLSCITEEEAPRA